MARPGSGVQCEAHRADLGEGLRFDRDCSRIAINLRIPSLNVSGSSYSINLSFILTHLRSCLQEGGLVDVSYQMSVPLARSLDEAFTGRL